jgi:hypothetical protein
MCLDAGGAPATDLALSVSVTEQRSTLMPQIAPAGATIDEVTHHVAEVNGVALHYVTAGQSGTPVLLVHGFPESWWAFREVIPLLAAGHQVIAVDLPGFAESARRPDGPCTSTWVADSLRRLIEHLDHGPVHLTGQDISGPATFRWRPGTQTSSAATPGSRPVCPLGIGASEMSRDDLIIAELGTYWGHGFASALSCRGR